MVDCTDGNRFREVKPGEFFRGYSSAAYMPAFADADAGPENGNDSSVLGVEPVPQRGHSKRLADKAAARRGHLATSASAAAADESDNIGGVAVSLDGSAVGFAHSSESVAPQGADGAAGQGDLPVQQSASGFQLLADFANGNAKVAAPTAEAACVALHAGVLPAQSAAIVSHERQLAQPQLQVASKHSMTSDATGACRSGREHMHAHASAPAAACELPERPDSTVQVPPPAHDAIAEQPKSPGRTEPAQQLQLPQGPGTAASAQPASPRRLTLRANRSRSPPQSPARRRGRATAAQQHNQQQQQQHMLKLKDFPPAAEFSRLMARHNQVRRTLPRRPRLL